MSALLDALSIAISINNLLVIGILVKLSMEYVCDGMRHCRVVSLAHSRSIVEPGSMSIDGEDFLRLTNTQHIAERINTVRESKKTYVVQALSV